MRQYICLLCIILSNLVYVQGKCQTLVKGQVVDIDTHEPVANVSIQNIYTGVIVTGGNDGNFTMEIQKGQLIEFKKDGYNLLRVRIPEGILPPFFKVNLQKTNYELQLARAEENGPPKTYYDDSVMYSKLYKHELNFPKLTGLQAVQHPFSALSKKNQEIWAFQKEYSWFQKEKYIDYTFNEKLVNSITGLKSDSLQTYMHMFRPTYEQLRSMNEYTFYTYIRRTGELYRKRGIRARMSIERGAQ